MYKRNNIKFQLLFVFLATFFLSILIFKLIDLAHIIFLFPKEDYSVHLAKLFFFSKYGFHELVPNWYDGFILFQHYPPGFYFYSILFYKLLGNLQLAFYFSIISIYVLGLISVYWMGKILKLSKVNTALFAGIFFANPIAVESFFYFGRITELFAWVLFIILICFLYYYKNRKLDKTFLFLVPLCSLIILTHPAILSFSLFLLFGFILYKQNFFERIYAVLLIAFSFLLTSFWWHPFIFSKATFWDRIYEIIWEAMAFYSEKLILRENLFFFILPLFFLIILFFYLKKFPKENSFFLPVIVLSILCITKLIAFIPILNNPYPLSYHIFFIFMILLIIFKIDTKLMARSIVTLILILLLVYSILIMPYSTKIPTFEKNDPQLLLLKKVDAPFVFVGYYIDEFSIYGPAAVLYDLKTPFGWFPQEESEKARNYRYKLFDSIDKNDCPPINEAMDKVGAVEIITVDNKCSILKYCGLHKIEKINNACLYKVINLGNN
ncbi:MAG: 6-pyruvoyl-tetrahydropterin synthase-related protein [Candidatus Diapherotrites archaeon]